jgi:glycosyltransferase involved in cell wall biosynthesis
MKIAHVNFASGFRGGERQTLNLIGGLSKSGFEQILVCRRGSELQRRATQSGIATCDVLHPLLGHARSLCSDIIHVHEARAAYWAAIEHAMRKTEYVITRRIPNPISNSSLTTGIYRRAAGLVGVSQDVSDRLSRQVAKPVNTILSSTSDLAPKLETVQKIKRYLGRGPIIGHVGALHDHHKGQSVLIEAFHKLTLRVPEAKLILIGEGPDQARFARLANGDKRIMLLGSQEEVGAWIAAMDVFAFPSREEGLGSTVLDAMALGVPVIASAVGGLPELLGENERGLLLASHDSREWADAIANSLAHDDARGQRVRAAYRFALQHDTSRMVARYIELYESVQRNRQSDKRGIAQLTDEEFWAQIDANPVQTNWRSLGNYSSTPHREPVNRSFEDI